MFTYRRALIAAAFLLTIFYLTSRSHSSPSGYSKNYGGDGGGGGGGGSGGNGGGGGNIVPAMGPKKATTTSPSSSTIDETSQDAPAGQKPLQDPSKMTLYDRLAYQYPYDSAAHTKFPAYVWQTWKYTPAEGEFNFREQEATWTELHPGFIHEVITDSVAKRLLQLLYASVPEVMEAYDALPLPVLKADFFRYLILLARGGIYSDIDTVALKSAVHWIPHTVPREAIGLVVGIEADPDRPDWQDWYSRRIQFCQWTIQAKPGHPVLRDIVTRITKETLRRKRAGLLSALHDNNVIEYTGPGLWTDIIFEYFNDPRYFDMSSSQGSIDWHNFTGMDASKRIGDVVVLPITSFSPGVQQMGAKDYDDPMAFVKHDFEGTWKPENERHIGESVQQEEQQQQQQQQQHKR